MWLSLLWCSAVNSLCIGSMNLSNSNLNHTPQSCLCLTFVSLIHYILVLLVRVYYVVYNVVVRSCRCTCMYKKWSEKNTHYYHCNYNVVSLPHYKIHQKFTKEIKMTINATVSGLMNRWSLYTSRHGLFQTILLLKNVIPLIFTQTL